MDSQRSRSRFDWRERVSISANSIASRGTKRVYGGRGYRPVGGGGGLGFGPPFTPPVVKQLLIATACVFGAQLLTNHAIDGLFTVRPYDVWQRGFVWQPFTYMWLHGGLLHIALNCLMLWMFGSPLAMAWGPQRFLRFYFVCGVGAGVLIATVPYLFRLFGAPEYTTAIPTLGASGAIYGVILAYSLTWPERTIMMFPFPIPFRAIWLIPTLFFMSLLFDPGNVSHVGHLSGAAVGWLYLRSTGDAGAQLSLAQLKYRWKRYRMRRKLRAVQYEEWESKRRDKDRDRERRYH
jgi:membrane associated rhomboid family serine protease